MGCRAAGLEGPLLAAGVVLNARARRTPVPFTRRVLFLCMFHDTTMFACLHLKRRWRCCGVDESFAMSSEAKGTKKAGSFAGSRLALAEGPAQHCFPFLS